MTDKPVFDVTLRKYELPTEDFDRNLRLFLLSMGLIRPGTKKSPLEVIFKHILVEKKPISVEDLAEMTGITESAVRYHLERLKALRLVDGRKEYFLAENDLSVAFRVFRRYVLEEILDRIEGYVSALVK